MLEPFALQMKDVPCGQHVCTMQRLGLYVESGPYAEAANLVVN